MRTRRFLLPLVPALWIAAGWAAEALAPVDVNVHVKADAAVTDAPRGTLAIVAPRGGDGSGQVVIQSSAALTSLKATCSALVNKTGAKLPESNVTVRYATRLPDLGPDNFHGFPWEKLARTTFDGLSDTFVPGEKVQPVWVTVHVPPEVQAEDYQGTLTLSASGGVRTMPVQVSVCAFQMPKVGAQRMWVSMTESPDTLAERYKVTPWSDGHFRVLEQQFRMMGQLGNSVVYLPVITRTAMGEATGLIYFVKKGGQLVPDFTAFERYMNLYIAQCGKPRVVIVNVWNPSYEKAGASLHLSVAKSGGGLETVAFPLYSDDQKPLWKAVMEGVFERAGKLDIPKHGILIGTSWDGHPTKTQLDFWNDVAPGVKWANFTHGYGGLTPNAAYVEQPDGPLAHGRGRDSRVADYFLRGVGTSALAANGIVKLNTQRDIHDDGSAPWVFRLLHDASVDGAFTGFARVGMDYWPIPDSDDEVKKSQADRKYRPRAHILYERYGSGYGRLYRHPDWAVTLAGPAGPLPTARFMALREGFQQAEARLVCEGGLKAGRLSGPDLEAARNAVKTSYDMEYTTDEKGSKPRLTVAPEWQTAVRNLYQAAGLVQEKTADK